MNMTRILLTLLIILSLPGCITATYTRQGDDESFVVRSLWKSVDGLRASRDDEGEFKIIVDRTHTQLTIEEMVSAVRAYEALQSELLLQ